MASRSQRTFVTNRDIELLAALDRCPLTVEQFLKVSRSFAEPFASDSRVRGRLQALREAGWVRRWQYATASRGGAPDYYKLTLAGYRLLYDMDAGPPTKRCFAEVGLAHQHHTQRLADFIVHTVVCAHEHGLAVIDFCRENTLQLRMGDESFFPDCAFRVRLPGHQFNFMVELDNGTERVRSHKDVESWERKIRLYDQHQDATETRFRVLVVTTRSRERLDRILEAAALIVRNPQRSLFYGVHFDDYLAGTEPLCEPCFRDQRLRRVAMIPMQQLPFREAKPPAVLAHVGGRW